MIGARTRHYQQSNTANMTNAPSNRSCCGHRHRHRRHRLHHNRHRRRFPRRHHRSRRRHVHAPCQKHHRRTHATADESVAAITAHAVATCTSPPTTSCGRRAHATTGNILRIPALSLTATVTVKYVYSESSSPASTNLDATGHPSQVRTRHHSAKQCAQQWPSQPGAELWYATANNIDHATVACTKRPPSTDNIKQTPPPTPRHHHR
jgi:hypothetical protein